MGEREGRRVAELAGRERPVGNRRVGPLPGCGSASPPSNPPPGIAPLAVDDGQLHLQAFLGRLTAGPIPLRLPQVAADHKAALPDQHLLDLEVVRHLRVAARPGQGVQVVDPLAQLLAEEDVAAGLLQLGAVLL